MNVSLYLVGCAPAAHVCVFVCHQDPVSGPSEEDDDTASVTSERSAFSISSEVSISPYAYAKYPHPVTVSTCTLLYPHCEHMYITLPSL